MNAREAKRYACTHAGESIRTAVFGADEWTHGTDDTPEADQKRIESALLELAEELIARGGSR